MTDQSITPSPFKRTVEMESYFNDLGDAIDNLRCVVDMMSPHKGSGSYGDPGLISLLATIRHSMSESLEKSNEEMSALRKQVKEAA